MKKSLGSFWVAVCLMSSAAMGATLAYDEAGNYAPATFVSGANLGMGFGAWEFWNVAASLGDSTAGGGGNLNSANNLSFRFMSTGNNDWCNARRNLGGALVIGDVLSFTFTYNWDGGGRGVDIFSADGQFANLIDVSGGNTFKVNGTTVSTEWSPGAVVAVQITQLADGIGMLLTRTTNGTVNLNYSTNILHAKPATGVSMYCGGYTSDADSNPNYAIYMNNMQIVGEERRTLEFTTGTWNPIAMGGYNFALTRVGSIGDEIELVSSNPDAVTVPESVTFDSSDTVAFDVTVISLTNGPATITATDASTGVSADYTITPVAPVLSIAGPWELYATGPANYTLTRSASVGTSIVLSSSDTGVLTVTSPLTFGASETQKTFSVMVYKMGTATITATHAASGAVATFNVTIADPAIALSGLDTVFAGTTKAFIVTRTTTSGVGGTVTLSSSDPEVLEVPATATFAEGARQAYFIATAVSEGEVIITADSDDVAATTLSVTVAEAPGILAADDAGNYTAETFVNGANKGTGFGTWNMWNEAATLGDSTSGGGGNLNSDNDLSFQFLGGGESGWCNAQRNFSTPLNIGDSLLFTFTYNWDGGGRGVDIFDADGQFANLINVTPGNTFEVNGTTISTEYSPGAVVAVQITQLEGGIQLYLSRTVGDTVNLVYITTIENASPATGVSMYCGGHDDNINYAIFMNDMFIIGEAPPEPTTLTFTAGTWDPAVLGAYTFELTRTGDVSDVILLSSDNEDAVTVPATVSFAEGATTVTFAVSVNSLTDGDAMITAYNEDSDLTAEYILRPVPPPPPSLTFGGPWEVTGLGPVEYTLTRTLAVGATIRLNSGSVTDILTFPATVTFEEGATTLTFIATAIGYGQITIWADDDVTGIYADYEITVSRAENPPIPPIVFSPTTHNFTFSVPEDYDLSNVYGADFTLTGQNWNWQTLTYGTDYTVTAGVVTILTGTSDRRLIRIGLEPQ